MGTVYKRGTTWTAEVTCGKKISKKTGEEIPDRRKKGGFLKKSDAYDYIPILKTKREEEQKRPATTLAKLWDGYSGGAMSKLSKDKQSHYKTAYKKIAALHHTHIHLLTINDLQDVVDEKAPTYYPARDIKTLLSHLYTRAFVISASIRIPTGYL